MKYYNAKPSKVSNIGKDVSGARRMNFNTYETEQEKKARKKANKDLKNLKAKLKEEILSESADCSLIAELMEKEFELKFDFSPDPKIADSIIKELREDARVSGESEKIKKFNSMIGAFNKVLDHTRRLRMEGYKDYELKKLKRRYKPKTKTIGEECGQTFEWKNFEEVENLNGSIDFLEKNTSAVQFGNSVTDNERTYICKKLTEFLKRWKGDDNFKNLDASPVSWSFGARGKSGSVAYYEPARRVISVNRNNIGSLIHEMGHFIDYASGLPSHKISSGTVKEYRDKIIESGVTGRHLRYYCSKKEIFARAFEAYCLSKGFDEFSLSGCQYLPELTEELVGLIESVFENK